ncbi:sigma-70 family RNA polymerase sigma factor [Halanaerobium saccharolyticum]|uniref:sigma-70 family RNA polymerase sigma factor n=1 Tax=Halanaerobium saccharolyticum TaxID=43595 RepID=UPI003FCED62B
MNKWSNEWVLDNADKVFDEKFIKKVYNIFTREHGVNHQDAENLTNEVVGEKVYLAFKNHKFKGNSKKEFWGYIRSIIRNAKNDHFNKHNLLPEPIEKIFSQNQDQVLHVNLFKESVEQLAILNETIDLLAENLTDDQWEVLRYTAIGLDSKEISQIIEKSPAAVRKLRQRGREKAKNTMRN